MDPLPDAAQAVCKACSVLLLLGRMRVSESSLPFLREGGGLSPPSGTAMPFGLIH